MLEVNAEKIILAKARRYAAYYYGKHKAEWACNHPSHLASKAIAAAGILFGY